MIPGHGVSENYADQPSIIRSVLLALPLPQFLAQLAESGLLTEADVSAFMEALPETERPQDGEQLARRHVGHERFEPFSIPADAAT